MKPGETPLVSYHWLVSWIAVLALAGVGCGNDAPAPGSATVPSDTGVGDTSIADTSATVVPYRAVSLRIQPIATAEPVLDASAGTPLRVIESRSRWLRVATWDGRAGWIHEDEIFELPLWVHYQESLGGVPPSDLRPAYPLADGRWAVEAPYPSGMTVESSVWVDGVPVSVIDVATIEDVQSACGARRMAILANPPAPPARLVELSSGAARADRANLPALDRALLAAPGAPSPRLRRLTAAPATPTPAQAQAVAEASRPLLEGRGDDAVARAIAAAEWLAIGEEALWVRLAGEMGGSATEAEPWAATFLVLSARAEVHVVVPPYATPNPRAVRLRHAFATGSGIRPTLLVVERTDHDGPRIELYAARATDVRRIYTGYGWEC